MIKANFNTYASYVTDSLYQWDLNQVLSVSGLNLSVAPEVHFSNANMDKAIVRQATMTDHVVSVQIPNSLLQDPLTIYAHIGIYEGDKFKVVEKIEIPVIPKERPVDYQIQDSDEEIYSFNQVLNALGNKADSARVDNIIAHNNDTEGNTELVDIRVDIAGNRHNSAGEAVRNQFIDMVTRTKDMTYHTNELQLVGYYEPVLSFENKLFKSDTGALVDNDTRAISNFIYCPPNATVDIVCNTGYNVANTGNYDEYGNYLGHGPNFTGMTFRRYVVCKSTLTDPITPEEAVNNVTVKVTLSRMVTEDRLNGVLRNYARVSNGKNLLDRSTSELGFIWTDAGKIVITDDTYRTSDYIPLDKGDIITISPRLRKFLAYDENFRPISDTFVDATIINYTYTAKEKGYIRFTYFESDKNVQVEYGSSVTEYEDYKVIIDPSVEIPENRIVSKLTGKTGLSFGDSIMYGSGNNGEGILDILHELYNVGGNDYSVGGASVEKIEDRCFIGDQISTAINDGVSPDFIIFDGLSNDIEHGSPGEISANFNYVDNGYATFASGLEYCIGLLRDNYPTVPIVYVIPHSSAGRDYSNELKYGDIARKICKKWSVPIADVYRNGNITARVVKQLQAYTYYPTESSGTHPNRAGYERAYIPLIVSILNDILI